MSLAGRSGSVFDVRRVCPCYSGRDADDHHVPGSVEFDQEVDVECVVG